MRQDQGHISYESRVRTSLPAPAARVGGRPVFCYLIIMVLRTLAEGYVRGSVYRSATPLEPVAQLLAQAESIGPGRCRRVPDIVSVTYCCCLISTTSDSRREVRAFPCWRFSFFVSSSFLIFWVSLAHPLRTAPPPEGRRHCPLACCSFAVENATVTLRPSGGGAVAKWVRARVPSKMDEDETEKLAITKGSDQRASGCLRMRPPAVSQNNVMNSTAPPRR